MVPAAKRLLADLLEIAAPEIEKVVSERKNPTYLQKLLKKKQFENTWEVEKRNPCVEQGEPFFEKVVRKSVALAKTRLTKKMSANQSSHFWYVVFTNLPWRFLIKSHF